MLDITNEMNVHQHHTSPTSSLQEEFQTAYILQQLAKGSCSGKELNDDGSQMIGNCTCNEDENLNKNLLTSNSSRGRNSQPTIPSEQVRDHMIRRADNANLDYNHHHPVLISPPASKPTTLFSCPPVEERKKPPLTEFALEASNSCNGGCSSPSLDEDGGRAVGGGGDEKACLHLPIRPLHAPPKLSRFPATSMQPSRSNPVAKLFSHTTTDNSSGRIIMCSPALASSHGQNNNMTIYPVPMLVALAPAPHPSTSAIMLSRGRAISISEMTSIDHSTRTCSSTLSLDGASCYGNKNNASGRSNSPGVMCKMDGCQRETTRRSVYCFVHFGQRKCDFKNCHKFAQGRTRFCIGHGGGRRCTVDGCGKAARDEFFCASHGGGKRCKVASCNRLAIGKGQTCTSHRAHG